MRQHSNGIAMEMRVRDDPVWGDITEVRVVNYDTGVDKSFTIQGNDTHALKMALNATIKMLRQLND